MNNQKEDEIEKMNAALSTIETGYRTPEFESGFKEGWKERGYAASTPSEQGSDGWISMDEYERIALERLSDKSVIQMLLADKRCGTFKEWPSNIQRMIDKELGAVRETRVKLPRSKPVNT